MQKEGRFRRTLSILGILVLLVVSAVVLRHFFVQAAGKNFSESALLFCDYGMRVVSYSFPCTELILEETPLLENKARYYIDPQFHISHLLDIGVAHESKSICLLYDCGGSYPAHDQIEFGVLELNMETGTQKPALEPNRLPPVGKYELLSLSPNGNYFAFVIEDQTRQSGMSIPLKHIPEMRVAPMKKFRLCIFDKETKEFFEVHADCDYSEVSWLPDSESFLFGSAGTIYRFWLKDRQTEPLREGTLPSLSADGAKLAYFAHGKLRWGGLASKEPEHVFTYRKLMKSWIPFDSFTYSPEPVLLWSPDSSYLMIAQYGEGGISFKISFPFIHLLGWDKIFILDAEKDTVIYKNKLPSFGNRIVWTSHKRKEKGSGLEL